MGDRILFHILTFLVVSFVQFEGTRISAAWDGESQHGCELPSKWAGIWFQSGSTQHISINSTSMSSKGKCVESQGEKFIFKNEAEGCFRCLVFHEKHPNVVQYKESEPFSFLTFNGIDGGKSVVCRTLGTDGSSFCMKSRTSFASTCGAITGDAFLYSMFKIEGEKISCPFLLPPTTFTYNRGGGECQTPTSNINSCISPSKISLKYEACPDIPGSESSTEEVECVASWKEGSSRFFLGLVNYKHHASYEERFRCFSYEKFSPPIGRNNLTYKLAMSGDATCNGLSSMEGSRTLNIRAPKGKSRCNFPPWLKGEFQTVEENYTNGEQMRFVFNSNGILVSNGTTFEELMKFECFDLMASTENEARIIMDSTINCEKGYKAVIFHKRAANIIEIELSETKKNKLEALETLSLFENFQLITLISIKMRVSECADAMVYEFREECPNSFQFNSISIGCRSSKFLNIEFKCPSTSQILSSEFNCNGFWEEYGVKYFIASNSSYNNPKPYLFKITKMTGKSSNGTEDKVRKIKGAFVVTGEGPCFDYGTSTGTIHHSMFTHILMPIFLVKFYLHFPN